MGNRGTRTFPGKLRSDIRDFAAIGTGTLVNRPLPRFPGRLYYASDTQTVYIDTGSAWVTEKPASLLAHSEGEVQTANSTAEIDLVNTTVAAGAVLAGDSLHLHARTGVFNSTGLGFIVRWRVYLGGTLITDSGSIDNFATGVRWRWQNWEWDFSLISLTQTWWRGSLTLFTGDPAAETTFMQANMIRTAGNETLTAANWATATAIRLTATMSTASGSALVRTNGFYLNRLPG
jgi:hypothetical protein